MRFFDRHPNLFRFVYLLILIYIILVLGIRIYDRGAESTDENWFSQVMTRVMVAHDFTLAAKNPPLIRGYDTQTEISPDQATLVSLKKGQLLLGIDRTKIQTLADVQRYLPTIAATDKIFLNLIDPQDTKSDIILEITKADLPDSIFQEIPPALLVFEVIPGGASDRAGMQVGDLIYQINHRQINNPSHAQRILNESPVGQPVAYHIIRAGEESLLHVSLVRIGLPFWLIVGVICAVIFMGVGSFLALMRPQFPGARLVGLGHLLVGAVFLLGLSVFKFTSLSLHESLLNYTFYLALIFGPAFWVHSSYYFPQEITGLSAHRWLNRVPYLIAILALINPLTTAPARFHPFVGVIEFHYFLIVMFLFYLTVTFIYRHERTPEYTKINRIFISVTLVAILLSFLIVLAGLDKSNIPALPFLLIPLTYLYVVGRYQLFNLNIRIRQNIQYNALSFAWNIFILIVLVRLLMFLPEGDLEIPAIHFTGTYIEVTDEPLTPRQQEVWQRTFLMFSAIVLAMLAWKIKKAGQSFLDEKYYRAKYDYRRAASELSEVMATHLNLDELARGIVRKLAVFMHVRRVGILICREARSCHCQAVHGLNDEMWQEFCQAIRGQMSDLIGLLGMDTRVSVEYLPTYLKDEFLRFGFRQIIPIHSSNRPIGILLIGEKRSESPYNQEDISFLTAIAKQASVAIENSFLYERLAGQERLKHELDIARRIQMDSLPQKTPTIKGLDITGISVPAHEVGGDYYDFLNGRPEHDQITIIVGDVSGKGTSAALYMAKVQGILHSLHSFNLSPRELFVRANRILCADLEKRSFVTALGADFNANTGQLLLARAGHLPLFYYQAHKGTVSEVIPTGMGLALNEGDLFEANLEERTIDYDSGDVFLFITDGLTEAHNQNGDEFGEEKIKEILRTNAHEDVQTIQTRVLEAVANFAADTDISQHDDQTIVVVKVR